MYEHEQILNIIEEMLAGMILTELFIESFFEFNDIPLLLNLI